MCLVRDWVPESEIVRSGLLGRATVVRGDVRDGALLERMLGEYEIDTVLHLAAQTIVGIANRNPLSTFETNVAGTWALLEACRRSPTVRQIVLASSDKAYGDQALLPYREDTPLEGTPSVRREQVVRGPDRLRLRRTYELPVAITRCGNFFGGGDLNWNRIVPGTIRSVLRGERPVIRSDGTLVRDYFYVEDGAAAYMRLAEWLAANPEGRGEAFNFSNETQLTVSELVERILGLMGSDLVPEVTRRGDPRDPGAVPRRVEGAQRRSAGGRSSRSTRASSGRSPGTAKRWERPRDRAALPLVRRASTSRRCSPSARRRSRTRSSRPSSSTSPSRRSHSTSPSAPACSLVQITETVPPEVLFRDYVYFSSFSDTMLRHATELADELVAERDLGPESLVVEAASNDGYLLGIYRERGVRVLGHRAGAKHRGRGARSAASPRSPSSSTPRSRSGSRRRERAPTSSTRTTCSPTSQGSTTSSRASRTLLADDGIAVIEVPYVKDMLDRCEFDTIYHEHLCYFSVTALDALVRRHGLELVDVERVPIHGGSLRLRVGHEGASEPTPSGRPRCSPRSSAWGVSERGDLPRVRGDRVRRARGRARRSAPALRSSGARIAALRCRGEGQHAPQRVRHRPRDGRVRRRPEHAEAGPLHARREDPDRAARSAPRPRCPTTSCSLPGTSPTRWSPSRHDYRAQGRPVHRPRSRAGGARAVIDGVQVVPLRRIPDERGTVMHMLQAHRPALRRVRRDLLLDDLPRRREGMAPARGDDAQLRLRRGTDQARRLRRPRGIRDAAASSTRSSSGPTRTRSRSFRLECGTGSRA